MPPTAATRRADQHPRAIPARPLTRREVAEGIRLALAGDDHYERPRTRADCVEGLRPCPFVGCWHHLATEVTRAGSLRLAWAALKTMPATCALDVAGDGCHTLDEVGRLLNLTRERVRQIQDAALEKLRATELGRDEYARSACGSSSQVR